jgi:hypothetical protein
VIANPAARPVVSDRVAADVPDAVLVADYRTAPMLHADEPRLSAPMLHADEPRLSAPMPPADEPATSPNVAPREDVNSIDRGESRVRREERVITRREGIRVTDPRSIEAAPPTFDREPPIAILPAARPAHAPVNEPPAQERVVHVRIGSIEIQAASSPASALPVAAATAMRPTEPQPPSGFDSFVRLRRYTSWDW